MVPTDIVEGVYKEEEFTFQHMQLSGSFPWAGVSDRKNALARRRVRL